MIFFQSIRISKIFFCLMVLTVVSGRRHNEHPVVKLFQEYLKIQSTTNSDLTPAVQFWLRLAIRENVPIAVFEFVKGYPVVVMKWAGTHPTLKSVMLNSHMDVVPADIKEGWKYPPFAAFIEDNGDIYGRGTQDMKSLSIQQFEALRRLKNKKVALLRDVYMTLMPDEETGGIKGMGRFIMSQEFEALNVGVELDEGGSQIPPLSMYSQRTRPFGGGSAVNVLPGHVSFSFDVRLGSKVDEQQFLWQLDQWIRNAGDNVTLTFLVKDAQTPRTVTNDSNPYWRALTRAACTMNITLNPIVTTGATDGKYLRAIGIPAFGLSPMMNTPLLPHKVNERLNIAEFLKGLDLYEQIVRVIANIPSDHMSDNSFMYLQRN